jgi:hypothetical protein
MKKRNFNFDRWMFFIYTPIIIVLIYFGYKQSQSSISLKSKVNTEENVPNNGCVGFGNESCIDRVKENFTNTGKQILGEQYIGNGQFGISFLDPSKGQTFNSQVSTDCNCKIINVSVQVMR